MLEPAFFDIRGWPAGEADIYGPILAECFDRGAHFEAKFEGEALAALMVVDNLPLGPAGDLVQLEFLHVGRPYRGIGIGKALFESAEAVAGRFGASGLYITATPSENTINFYRSRGCVVTPYPDARLLALEPEDIHMERRF